MEEPLISKSKYLDGLQCHKRLWVEYHAQELMTETGQADQAILDQGKAVGNLAKCLYPDGIEVTGEYTDFEALATRTSELLPLRKPLFEPAFIHDAGFARVDILLPAGEDAWDIVEVKSTGEVKDHHIDDVAMQYHVCRGTGIPIRRCYVMHVDKEYIRQGEIDPHALLTSVEVTRKVVERSATVGSRLFVMQRVVTAETSPPVRIGPHCGRPYECPLHDHCWAFLPLHNVFTLNHLFEHRGFELMDQGIVSILKLPHDYLLTRRMEVQVNAVRTGMVQIDRQQIREFLASLKYPLYFLDFETLNPAIPLYEGTSPFKIIPFQYSLHILKDPDVEPIHYEFLAEGKEDPRPEIIRKLRIELGSSGSIVAYSDSFERRVLGSMCLADGPCAEWCSSLEDRFVDLHQPFASFMWYHPDQLGRTSQKSVLPLLTGLSYGGMEIREGGAASSEFLRIMNDGVSDEEREHIRESLKDYCRLDTFGMVRIVKELYDA